MKKNLFYLFMVFAVVLTACTKDPETASTVTPNENLFKSGVYIVNEGNFNAGNASIDLYSKDSNKVIRNIFTLVNNRPLGEVANSMSIVNQKGYIILNGSAKIEVINANNAKSIASINGFTSPRYMVAKDTTRGFVSDWFANEVKEINLLTNTITRSIKVGAGPEGMCIVGNKLYVANCGGYELDSTISVIDLISNTEINKIKVGDAPLAIQLDENGNIWVLCRGSYGKNFMIIDDDTKGALVKINPNNDAILATIELGEKGDHPVRVKMNAAKNTMYFLSSYNLLSGVFKFNITDVSAPTSAFISGYYYGLGYDKVSDELYLADAVDFIQNGFVKRYNSAGTLKETYSVGIIPNGIQEQ
jgi:YVTN family beta-propeller protein